MTFKHCALILIPFALLTDSASSQCTAPPALNPTATPSWIDFVEDTGVFASSIADPDEKDMVAADIDNDGDLDVIIVRKENFYLTGGRSHRILLNNGGVFTDVSGLVTGPSLASRDVALGDFNNDGFIDFCVANTTTDLGGGMSAPAPVGLYLNDSTTPGVFAGFTAATSWLTACTNPCGSGDCDVNLRSCAIAVGDVNNDGLDDIWATTYGPGSIAVDTVSGDRLYLNNPASPGTFTDVTYDSLGCIATSQTAGSTSGAMLDFDNDGKLDLFRGGPFTSYEIIFNSMNLPSGTPLFVQTSPTAVGGGGYMGAAGDVNGDGFPDLYIVRDDCDSISINPGGSAARVSANWTTFPLQNNAVHGKVNRIGGNVIFGDLDGDGFNEVGVGDIDTSVPSSTTDATTAFGLLRNRTQVAGTFGGVEDSDASEALAINITSNSVWDGLFMDLDGDGLPGVLFATEAGYRYFEQLPYGSNFGPTSANSVGTGAVMGYEGRPSITENNFTLTATGAPATVLGQFFVGASTTSLPLADGTLLVGAPQIRLTPTMSDVTGKFSTTLDFGSPALAGFLGGTQLYFQLYYRDPGFGLNGSNLSDGLEVVIWD